MTRNKNGIPSETAATRSQREVLRDVMLSAAECGGWLTLRELSKLTNYGEASISAQLRHLRKPKYGSFVIDKQVRQDDMDHVYVHGAVWEYRLRGVVPLQNGKNWLGEKLRRGSTEAVGLSSTSQKIARRNFTSEPPNWPATGPPAPF
jgi:hypothetical protein